MTFHEEMGIKMKAVYLVNIYIYKNNKNNFLVLKKN